MTNTMWANGGGPAPLTLLGQGPARISTAGKIRAGIKVLTRKAAEHPQAKEIYEQGVAAGQSFEQIEQTLKWLVTLIDNSPPTVYESHEFQNLIADTIAKIRKLPERDRD